MCPTPHIREFDRKMLFVNSEVPSYRLKIFFISRPPSPFNYKSFPSFFDQWKLVFILIQYFNLIKFPQYPSIYRFSKVPNWYNYILKPYPKNSGFARRKINISLIQFQIDVYFLINFKTLKVELTQKCGPSKYVEWSKNIYLKFWRFLNTVQILP